MIELYGKNLINANVMMKNLELKCKKHLKNVRKNILKTDLYIALH